MWQFSYTTAFAVRRPYAINAEEPGR